MNAAQLEWDYSELAAHYEQRAPYHAEIVATLRDHGAPPAPCAAADIGAGTGRFTRMLIAAGHPVSAVEPNPAMRAIGMVSTPAAQWHDTRAEHTGLASGAFGWVTFASSFNVVAADAALDEAARLLTPRGALVLLFNHRDLDDPLQREIEHCIRHHVPHYAVGTRREDPTPYIDAHAAFGKVIDLCQPLRHRLSGADFVAGFRAHATLIRQAGTALAAVLAEIAALVPADQPVEVPFITRAWIAHREG